MTDQERERAVQYWREVLGMVAPKYCANDSWQNFEKGYVAACEDRRAQIEWLMSLLDHYAQDVHREIVVGKLKMEHTDF